MKFLLAALAAFFAPALSVPIELSQPTPFRASFESVPQLRCGNAKGTGVRISDDIIITAKHVSDNGPCTAGYSELNEVQLITDQDFAVLRGRLGAGLRSIVSCEGINAGESYLGMGYALGGAPNVEVLIGTNSKKGTKIRMRGRVYPGMSGGPVRDSEGRVVALIVQYHRLADWAFVEPLSETYLCKDK